MPIKGQSPKEVVHTEMGKFKRGTLHSGSKHGPLVKSRKQAIAISLSESGQSNKKADGGAALQIAYAARRERAEGGQVFEGPIISSVPGRTDKHNVDVGSGSYVLPSETISHLGENNTLAGLEKIKQLGAHGLRKLVHSAHGAGGIIRKHKAKGGAAVADSQNVGRPVGVVVAGGEHVLSPEEVGVIGDGDVPLGHRLLDNWVMQNRKDHLATIRKLKPPARD